MLNKKFPLFMAFSLLSLFIVGCNPVEQDNNQLPDNEVVKVIKNFADHVDADYSNIKEDTYEWYNYAEIDHSSDDDTGHYYITWYSILVNGVKELPTTNEIFNWWYAFYIWDEMWSAAVEYSNDDVICFYRQWYEQEIPDELMAWEWDYENEEEAAQYDKARADFFGKVTYEIEVNCGYLPEWAIQYKDFYIDAQWEEAFWSAAIRWWTIDVFTPSGMQEDYIENILSDWENIIFKWYNVDWKLEKMNCVDGWVWENHEYKISFDLTKSLYWDEGEYDRETSHYEGCADKVKFDLVAWEEWTLPNLIKKTGYKYERDFDKNKVYYTVTDMVDRYASINMFEVDLDVYNYYQLILENVDGEWRVIFEWNWNDISDEKCEELNQYDNNLMDMFFLRTCPRW